jgi:hypothetical protein
MAFAARLAAKRQVAGDLAAAGQAVQYDGIIWPVKLQPTGQDALIGRSRSRTATQFLHEQACSVLVMIDHDITWEGPQGDYEGDLAHIARLAAEHNAIVGAMISKRVKHEGVASMVMPGAGGELDVTVGKPGLVEAYHVGSGMTAYPRSVLQAIYDKLGGEVPPGFCPMFIEAVVDHPRCPSDRLHVSEDWIVSETARKLGFKSYLATRPITGHYGEHRYTVLDDAYPPSAVQRPPEPEPEPPKPVISLLHATRWRPRAAQDAHDIWVGRASGDYRIEYIYSIDDDDGETRAWGLRGGAIVSGPSRGNVDAYNRAVYASHGDILVQVHDDVEPPQDWDRLIAERLGRAAAQEDVLHVDDGLDPGVNHNPLLIPIMICRRAWAERLGGLFYPGYVSICCDDDASEKAYAEDAVVDAKDLVFRHHWQGGARDDTQARSYSRANWEQGQALLSERRAAGFPDAPDRWAK